MFNRSLTEQENKEMDKRAMKILEFIREKGTFPRNMKVWESFRVKELIDKEENFPYKLELIVEKEEKKEDSSGAH